MSEYAAKKLNVKEAMLALRGDRLGALKLKDIHKWFQEASNRYITYPLVSMGVLQSLVLKILFHNYTPKNVIIYSLWAMRKRGKL